MEAFVTIQFEEGLSWEVECANNQLRFDTCHDSAAAFGRLIAQLQALCAPNVEQSVVQFTPRRPGGGSPHDSDSSGYISTNNSDACSEPSRDSWKQGAVNKSGSNSLLDGVGQEVEGLLLDILLLLTLGSHHLEDVGIWRGVIVSP
jgi:hypothetical protein